MSPEDDGDDGPGDPKNKPIMLRAVELILADPAKIKRETQKLRNRYRSRHAGDHGDEEIRDMAAAKIIQNYSYLAAFSGGATALTGIIPGLGQIIAAFGGGTADTALCIKFQIEMVMALASLYEHDIDLEEGKLLCFIIAGLGVTSEAAKKGAKGLGTKAFAKLVRKHLAGPALAAVKAIFKKLASRSPGRRSKKHCRSELVLSSAFPRIRA